MDEKEEKKLSFSDALSYAKGDVLEFREKLKTYSYEFNLLDENGIIMFYLKRCFKILIFYEIHI